MLNISIFLEHGVMAEEAASVKPWVLPAASTRNRAVCLMPDYAADWAEINTINYSADGTRIGTGGNSGNVRVWDATTLNLIAEKNYYDLMIRHVLFEDSENLIAVACERHNDLAYPTSRSHLMRLKVEDGTLVERSRPGNFLRNI